MQVVWEANTADFAKRKRAARACESCQKRKKRCHHTFLRDSRGDDAEIDQAISKLTHKDPVRFVGDLNPESILTDLSNRSKGTPRQNRLGTWVQTVPELDHHDTSSTTPAAKIVPASERYRQVERGRRTLTGHQRNYLQAAGAFRVLPKATQDVLVTSYIASIDGVLPVIDGGKFLQAYFKATASPFLVQAVCLVACKTAEATPYLRLTEDGELMDPISFARTLHTGLDAAMKADLESDRLTKVQILTLMSLHNDGPGGIEESSLHLLQAVHESHTAGLHILTAGRRTTDEASYTWWSIWVLDKINACLGGRAIMISDSDMGLPRPETVDSDLHARSAALRMWLALADVLAEVISYYRPGADQDSLGWENDFPEFRELSLGNKIAFNFDIPLKSHRDLLEIFYNVIAILTCRSGGPTTASYRRRVEAAIRIQELVIADTSSLERDKEKLPSGNRDNMQTSLQTIEELPPIPLVPYSISLALTVAYRQLRDQTTSTDLEQVKRNLEVRCALLEGLSKRWWSADAMAKLGRRALRSSKGSNKTGVAKNDSAKADEVSAMDQMLEAEVAVCKYGPFAQGAHKDNAEASPTLLSKTNGKKRRRDDEQDLTVGAQVHERNALDVLSSAAAAHRTTNSTMNLDGNVGDPYSAHNEFTTISYPTSTNDLPMLHVPEGGVSSSFMPSSSTTTTVDQNYLDNLFEDFFDVGMPTMFNDPLFGGDNFWPDLSFTNSEHDAQAEYQDPYQSLRLP